jgi:hypothetical protein
VLNAAAGLTDVSTKDLKTLLALIHKGELTFPLSIEELTRVGLQRAADRLLPQLRGLDALAVQTLTVCVVAERLPLNRPRRARAEAEAKS